MEDQTTQSENTTAQTAVAAVADATASDAAAKLGAAQAKLAAIEAQQAAEQAAAAESKKAAAEAKHAAEIAKFQRQAETEAAKAVALRGQLRDQMVLAHLPSGLKRPKDNPNLFVGMFTEGIELDDSGTLNEAALATIKARVEEHAYLFDGGADVAPGSPSYGGSARPAGNNWTPEETKVFDELNVKPGSYKSDKRYQTLKSTLFNGFGGNLNG
jgi:hypothetical protein